MMNMRERKYVKFSVAMYDDTKFKIIDRKPERDLIHYVWNRVMVLAGKTNQEGDLFMSRTIPYTVETLAIEFNRGTEEVKLALEVLIELEMVEFTEDGVYRVKNFAKHQNIKVKEKITVKDKDVELKSKEVQVAEVPKNESPIKEVKEVDAAKEQKQFEKENVNKINQNESRNVKKEETSNLEVNQKTASNVDDNITKENVDNNSLDSIPILLEVKNNNKGNKKNKKDEIFEENDDNLIDGIYNGERPLDDGELITMEFSMCN